LHLRALGARAVITRSDVTKGHPEYYQDLAERIAAETPGAFYVNQFKNPANPLAHETSTGPEIWEQMHHDVDAVVVGVGSSGTLTGLSRFFARVQPDCEIVLADPEGAAMTDRLETLQPSDSLDAVRRILDSGKVTMVMNGTEFVGLITRINLLNYLRRKI
jgi:cystathionine beta-synthase